MKRPIQFFLSTFLALATVATPAVAQAPRRMTYQQAVTTALETGPEVQIAGAGVEASEARVTSASRQRFPVLRVEGNIQYWNKALDVVFVQATPGMQPMPMQMAPALRVRDRTTSLVSVTLAQPISALLALHQLVNLEQAGLDVAKSDRTRARLDTAQRASDAYLKLLQAQSQSEVAAKSVTQLDAQVTRAQVLEKSGVMGQVDVLRLVSARDAAKGIQVQARAGVEIARAALVLALTLPPGTPVEVVDDFPDPPPPLNYTESQVTDLALKERPEMAAANQRVDQARGGRGVAKAALLPNVMGLLNYTRVEGQGPFQPKNAWFVGGTLSWDLWDWGKTWNGVKEADAKMRQAEFAASSQRDQLAFDARRRVQEARAAFESVGLSRSSLAASEEAYRIQNVRYQQGAATTTDVLDAELGVLRARTDYSNSRFNYYLAQAAVARAAGQMPGELRTVNSKGATNAETR
jgi:outer membrane protein